MASILRSRRHRNPQQTSETPQGEQQKPFFSGRQAIPSVQSKEKSDGAFFQPKLHVGEVGDKYEQEADSVANQVVNQTAGNGAETPSVQRLATPDEKNMPATNDGRMAQDKMIQEKPNVQKAEAKKEEEKPNIQKAEAKKEEEKPNIQKAEAKKEEEKPNIQKEEEKPNIQKAEAKKEEEKPNIQKAEAKDKGTPRDNEAQNKQFNDAIQEIQRKIGRKLSDNERQRLHHEISGQNFSYKEIIEHGIAMFRKK
ncbi:MAG: hypothetical protein JNL70_16960 [Saprospiraceae bacterium]|nr:hypothetical protein [Saprospiraceae bacterium]